MYNKYEKVRKARGLTNHEVATRAQIPPSSLYDWKQRSALRPDAGMSVAAIAKIATVLEVKIEDLL